MDGFTEIVQEQLCTRQVDLEEGVCGDEEIEAGEAFGEFPGRRLAKANTDTIVFGMAEDDTGTGAKAAERGVLAELGQRSVNLRFGERAVGRVEDGAVVFADVTQGVAIPVEGEFVAVVVTQGRGDWRQEGQVREFADTREEGTELMVVEGDLGVVTERGVGHTGDDGRLRFDTVGRGGKDLDETRLGEPFAFGNDFSLDRLASEGPRDEDNAVFAPGHACAAVTDVCDVQPHNEGTCSAVQARAGKISPPQRKASWNCAREKDSFGQWMRSSCMPNPTRRGAAPVTSRRRATMGMEAPSQVKTAPRGSISRRTSCAMRVTGESMGRRKPGSLPVTSVSSTVRPRGQCSSKWALRHSQTCAGDWSGTRRQESLAKAWVGMTVLEPGPP